MQVCGGGPSDQGFSVMLSLGSLPGGELYCELRAHVGPKLVPLTQGELEARKFLESVLQKQFVTTVCPGSDPTAPLVASRPDPGKRCFFPGLLVRLMEGERHRFLEGSGGHECLG